MLLRSEMSTVPVMPLAPAPVRPPVVARCRRQHTAIHTVSRDPQPLSHSHPFPSSLFSRLFSLLVSGLSPLCDITVNRDFGIGKALALLAEGWPSLPSVIKNGAINAPIFRRA